MSMTAKARRRFGAVAALALAAAGLSGCVYYPSNYAYGYGSGYYAAPAPVVVQPSVVVGGWWGGWGGGDWDDDWHGGGHWH
jgi:hypothetical protein